ncbi:MAG TPA: hypothetical protein VGD10_10180 [Allosphingosinicella sp.]|uniref:hypothetical protein n=1 Tax=Allosphingosinicella sp. TaxID=2823234 RepID=UPI002ED9057B
MNGTGRYRRKGFTGMPDIAWVTDRSISFEIVENLYRWRGYQPPYDELPWQHELPAA